MPHWFFLQFHRSSVEVRVKICNAEHREGNKKSLLAPSIDLVEKYINSRCKIERVPQIEICPDQFNTIQSLEFSLETYESHLISTVVQHKRCCTAYAHKWHAVRIIATIQQW